MSTIQTEALKLSLNFNEKKFEDNNPFTNIRFIEPFSNCLMSFLLWINIMNHNEFDLVSSECDVQTEYFSFFKTFTDYDGKCLPLQIFIENHVKFLSALIPTCR